MYRTVRKRALRFRGAEPDRVPAGVSHAGANRAQGDGDAAARDGHARRVYGQRIKEEGLNAE